MPRERLPYQCPSCQADLQAPGAVIGFRYLPEQLVGHVEPGEESGVVFVIDKMDLKPRIELQCADCGTEIRGKKFKIEDIDFDPEWMEENESCQG